MKMKAIQVALLVAMGALGGMLLMKWQGQQAARAPAPAPAAVAATPVQVPPPAPVPAAPAAEPAKPSPMAKKPAAKPQPPARAEAPRETAQAIPPPKAEAAPPAPELPAKPVEAPAPPVKAAPAPPPAPPPPQVVTVAAGTILHVRINESLSSEHNAAGDAFTASLDQPLVVEGFVIAERGARIEGRLVQADKGGRVKGVAAIALELTRLMTSDGQRVDLHTDVFQKTSTASSNKDAAKVGAAAGIGAIIGAIAGGGKGAAIGAAAGGAAGTGGVLATRGDPARIASETRLDFRIKESFELTEKRR